LTGRRCAKSCGFETLRQGPTGGANGREDVISRRLRLALGPLTGEDRRTYTQELQIARRRLGSLRYTSTIVDG
jgi:hypothetical protein